jgi:hypothetical protein
MRKRLQFGLLCATSACLAVAATALGAGPIGIYRNNMDKPAKRSQMVKLSGKKCERGGASTALKVVVGKRTDECIYRTPVLGRDLEVLVTGRLLSGTPKSLRRKIFLAANLRAGGGGSYQVAVFPLQRRFQIRKDLPNGSRQFIKVGKGVKQIKNKINNANKIRLRAFNITSGANKGGCRILVFINGKKVAAITDPLGGSLAGRYSGFSVGSSKNSSGAVASFDDVVVRVPSPF